MSLSFSNKQLVLGSSSKARAQLLKENGFEFIIKTVNIDEKAVCPDLRHDPSSYTLQVAQAKMRELIQLDLKDSIIITCDQVVSWNGQVREKPTSAQVNSFV